MYYDPYSPFNRYNRPARHSREHTQENLLAVALTVGLFVVLIFANIACM